MQPLSIPTDNLYKFMAIAGVAAILLTQYLLVSITTDQFRDHTQLQLENAYLGADLERAVAIINSIEKAEQSKKSLEDLVDNEPSLLRHKDFIETNMAELKQILDGNARLTTKIMLDYTRLEFLDRRRERWRSGLFAALFLSIALATFGFMLWYYRVQRYLDIDLRSRVGARKKNSNGQLRSARNFDQDRS